MKTLVKISLRAATIEDLDLVCYWDEQPHVIASDPSDDWNWVVELRKTPPWREQLVAMLGDRPIGFVQIIDPRLEETHYWGEIGSGFRAIDIWIGEASDLGRGYGTKIMTLALIRCFTNPSVKSVLIDPLATNEKAHRFYERLGFEFVEQRQFGQDQCYVYQLHRENFGSVNTNNPGSIEPV